MTAAQSMTDPANRLGLDYRREAARFRRVNYPIIDAHSHINGEAAAEIFRDAADAYGVRLIYSMTLPHNMPTVRRILGDRIRFIAIPNILSKDPVLATGVKYQKLLRRVHADGVRIAKFWAAPRGRDMAEEAGAARDAMALDAPHVQDSMSLACDLGMAVMVHVADPDTWFATKYSNRSLYGSKRDQYEAFEACLDRHPSTPFIAAHMGGWPEDLEFLSGLLTQHANLYLDTSAAKWMVRELSRYSQEDLTGFFTRWKGRILFGSDIVTTDKHLSASEEDPESRKASGVDMAYNLYASRYWALRTLLETDYHGESPIADPDLSLVDPEKYSEFDAPALNGALLPDHILQSLYYDTATALLDPLH